MSQKQKHDIGKDQKQKQKFDIGKIRRSQNGSFYMPAKPQTCKQLLPQKAAVAMTKKSCMLLQTVVAILKSFYAVYAPDLPAY